MGADKYHFIIIELENLMGSKVAIEEETAFFAIKPPAVFATSRKKFDINEPHWDPSEMFASNAPSLPLASTVIFFFSAISSTSFLISLRILTLSELMLY